MFDAQEYLSATEPPVYIDTKGRTHTGRVLSFREWLPFRDHMRAVFASKGSELDYVALRRVTILMTREMFPKPWWRIRNPVTRDVLSLPPLGMLSALWSFIKAQAKALGQTEELQLTESAAALLGETESHFTRPDTN